MIQSVCRSFVGAHPLRTRWSTCLSNLSRTGWRAIAACVLFFCLVAPPGAQALEALDGRIQAHGFVEMQLRTMSADFSDNWDLVQWYNIFNVELEVDLLQDTVGPLDLVSGYVRVEARFDCIYSRGCGMVKPVNTYGDRAKSLPTRLMDGETFTSAGQIRLESDGPVARPDRDPLAFTETPGFEGIYGEEPEDRLGPGALTRSDLMQCRQSPCSATDDFWKPWGAPVQFWRADRNNKIASDTGLPWENQDDGTQGSPFLVAMYAFEDFRFAVMPVTGGANLGNPLALMGPWLPKNFVEPNAAMADVVNPLDSSRVSPASLSDGAGANPMRPIPYLREDDPERSKIYVRDLRPYTSDDPERDVFGNPLDSDDVAYGDTFGWLTVNPLEDDQRTFNDRQATANEARGIFIPSAPLSAALAEGNLDTYNFNFSERQRAFNRGSSQQDEGELKEAYLDIEMFDSRLWMRVGKQTIVWGKTELFRTTDQFNPQDFALANLPSLEESRIALWAWRGVWSFYEVGPLSDVRAEMAFNFDEFESADLGACGEPFTINLVCSLTFGSMAHGFTGIGVVGQEQPPNPWDDLKGWEIGGRLEFRWDRYSFAITDFYGYDDFPHIKRLSTYNRNVDWRSGRPRSYMHREQDLQLSYDGTVGQGCATPVGAGIPMTANGEIDDNGDAVYVEFDGAGNSGCLYPGSSDRSVLANGKPYQVSAATPTDADNPWQFYREQFWNDTSRSDPDDVRPDCFAGTSGVEGNANQPDTINGRSAALGVDCLALADYDPRYDPENELATSYGTSQGRLDARLIKDKDLRWLNSYDPTLRYDPRNALESSPANLSVFNWVCATTVGFNELDPAACALTVFSSSKPAGARLDSPVSQVLAGILSGSPVINANIGKAAGDDALSYFSIIPDLMGIPLLALDTDVINTLDDLSTPVNEVLNTYDRRAFWAVETGVSTGSAADLERMRIDSREAESYNCLSRGFFTGNNDHLITCGGFAWFGQQPTPANPTEQRRANVITYFAAAFSPEQEALLGCGPFFQTECDSNGADLLWAEGSALLQSSVGNDSIGISFETLGIADLVPAEYGTHLMDNLSVPVEYRLDSRVIGSDGQLIRCKAGVTPCEPELGSAVGSATGLLDPGSLGYDGNPCNYTNQPLFDDANGNGVVDPGEEPEMNARLRSAGENRWNSRCWDFREYFVVKGIQPGTAAFEIQGLGGPKCTTADIGGPEGQAGQLPGCRNKWATIRYSNPGVGNLHPNNPAAGYIGNNYLGDVGDPTGQRTDYRQLDLAAEGFTWCQTGTLSPLVDPADCVVTAPDPNNPDASGLNWGVFSPDQITGCGANDQNRPECYLGGWVQDVDGDPDKLGIYVGGFNIDLPTEYNATSGLQFGNDVLDTGGYGTIIQRDYLANRLGPDSRPSGCTEMQAWIWMQRVDDQFGGGYMNHAECADVDFDLGAGHPFTGESFSSEVSGLSFNFMMLLVAFSEEFTDGIASVRGFVNPEIYNAKLYSDQPIGPGDANFGRTRIDDELLPCPELETDCDRLQRDPNNANLYDVLDVFPDLRFYEEQSPWGQARPNAARRPRLANPASGTANPEIARGNSGKIFSQGPNGSNHVWRGLIRTMLWDYAYTGSENHLMAMIPKCVDERATQERIINGVLEYTNPARINCREGSEGETLGYERCTFVTPQHCSLVQALYSVAGQKRNIMRAGGNGTFGRRTMQWQSGGEVYLSYEKRNVLGFSMDFAEDFTKSNWSTEFTYINGLPTTDANSYELTSRTNTYNLTVSVDRPTFVNFLNPNRTLFINSQWFFQYRQNYNDGMGPNGPVNVLATLAVFTGYFQDRLNPSLVGVYDFRSRSGAALPSVNYRFSEAFSITVGASLFFGRQQLQPMSVNSIAPAGERGGPNPYQDGTFGGLSLIRDRDEVYMTLRYTF